MVGVLLQFDDFGLFPDLPVREPLFQAQLAGGPRRRLLGLPLIHPRLCGLPAAWLRHHRRQGHADEGAGRIPRPRRLQNFM